MTKTFKLENLDCAHCASKMEDAIRKISGVESVSVNFMAQKLKLEAQEAAFEGILDQAVKACKKLEPDCEIIR